MEDTPAPGIPACLDGTPAQSISAQSVNTPTHNTQANIPGASDTPVIDTLATDTPAHSDSSYTNGSHVHLQPMREGTNPENVHQRKMSSQPAHDPPSSPNVGSKKKTKASIKIATLNMRGRETDKWNHINQMMRDRKIGVMAIQETHLTNTHTDQLHWLFGKRLHIINTIDEDEPNVRGVAIVLNK